MSAEYIQWLVYDLIRHAEHRTVDRCKSLRAACATNKESKAMCKSFLETHGFHEEAAKCLVGNGAENLAKDVMVRWKLTMQNTEDDETTPWCFWYAGAPTFQGVDFSSGWPIPVAFVAIWQVKSFVLSKLQKRPPAQGLQDLSLMSDYHSSGLTQMYSYATTIVFVFYRADGRSQSIKLGILTGKDDADHYNLLHDMYNDRELEPTEFSDGMNFSEAVICLDLLLTLFDHRPIAHSEVVPDVSNYLQVHFHDMQCRQIMINRTVRRHENVGQTWWLDMPVATIRRPP